MSGYKTWGLACRLNPNRENAWIFAVRGLDLALDGELLAMPGGLDSGDGLACSMRPQGFCKRFPLLRLESSLEEELRLRSSVFVRNVEEVGRQLALLNEQPVGIR